MSDDQDWKNAIKNYDDRLKKEKEAKKIKNKNASPRSTKAKIVQGGQAGLKQQRLKNYGKPSTNDDFVYPNIKSTLKKKHKHIDVVFMQGWMTEYHVAEEDAELVHKLDKDKMYHDIKSYLRTSIALKEKKVFVNKLNKLSKGYAFLDKIKGAKPVMREIVDCSDKKLVRKDRY